jgi:hypothetical protein
MASMTAAGETCVIMSGTLKRKYRAEAPALVVEAVEEIHDAVEHDEEQHRGEEDADELPRHIAADDRSGHVSGRLHSHP